MVVVKVFDSKGVKTIEINGAVASEVPYDIEEDEVLSEPTSELEEES